VGVLGDSAEVPNWATGPLDGLQGALDPDRPTQAPGAPPGARFWGLSREAETGLTPGRKRASLPGQPEAQCVHAPPGAPRRPTHDPAEAYRGLTGSAQALLSLIEARLEDPPAATWPLVGSLGHAVERLAQAAFALGVIDEDALSTLTGDVREALL
jgi:hypothetical protein